MNDDQLCNVDVSGGTAFPGQTAGAPPAQNQITDATLGSTAFPGSLPPTAAVTVEIWSSGGGGGAGADGEGGAGGSNGVYVLLAIPNSYLADSPTYNLTAGGTGGVHGGAAAGAPGEAILDLGSFGSITVAAGDVAGVSGTGPAMPGGVTNTTGLPIAATFAGLGAPTSTATADGWPGGNAPGPGGGAGGTGGVGAGAGGAGGVLGGGGGGGGATGNGGAGGGPQIRFTFANS